MVKKHKQHVRSASHTRGFKHRKHRRKPRIKLLPGSGKKGDVDGLDFDGYEAVPGDIGFKRRVYMKEETNYVRNGLKDQYDGEADKQQVDWEEDLEYKNEESVSEDEESEVSDWTDEESDDYSVYSD